jgi:hypothetical protein
MCPPEPIELKPAPDRKVTIENLHDPDRDCYFVRVTFASEDRYWTHDYYDGDDPEVYQAAFRVAWEASINAVISGQGFRGEF